MCFIEIWNVDIFPKWGRGYAKLYEYGTVKQTAGVWGFSMYQRFAADSAYRSSGILPVSLFTFFLGPQMARPKYCRVLSDTFPIFEINSS